MGELIAVPRYTSLWSLALECGHVQEPVSRVPRGGVRPGYHRIMWCVPCDCYSHIVRERQLRD
jgi:hypothetical protein